jgi:alanyl-tRNA synthetase/elongation factor 1-gamma
LASYDVARNICRGPAFGKVPLLETPEGVCIFESNAICRFIASSARSPLYPPAAATRARIDAWMDAFNTLDTIGPSWLYPMARAYTRSLQSST